MNFPLGEQEIPLQTSMGSNTNHGFPSAEYLHLKTLWKCGLLAWHWAGSREQFCKNPDSLRNSLFPQENPAWFSQLRPGQHEAGKYWGDWRILVKGLFWGKLSSFQCVVVKSCWAHGGMATILLRSVCDIEVKFVIWKVGTDPR